MKTAVDRVGETNRTKNGQLMTLIAYRSSKDVDVQFEDGSVKSHVAYGNFKRGAVSHPSNAPELYGAQTRIGQMQKNNQGLYMKIIAYHSFRKVEVEFKDGSTRYCTYDAFMKGSVVHSGYSSPNHQAILSNRRKSRLGKTGINNQGYKMRIIEYNSSKDVTVQFKDGSVRQHVEYSSFLRGTVLHSHIGDAAISNCGIPMKVIAYKNITDVDIQFDTGYVVTHKTYNNFSLGNIRHKFPYQMGCITLIRSAYIHNRIGNFYCHCNKCGIQDIMTITEMREHVCKDH